MNGSTANRDSCDEISNLISLKNCQTRFHYKQEIRNHRVIAVWIKFVYIQPLTDLKETANRDPRDENFKLNFFKKFSNLFLL